MMSPVKVCWTWLMCVNKPRFYWWELSSRLHHHSPPPFLAVPSSDGVCIGDISQHQPCSKIAEYLQLVLVLLLVSPRVECIPVDVNKKQRLKYIFLFTCSTCIYLQLMPQILYWVCIWAFWRGPPPGYVLLSEKGLCVTRCVLWVIVLHKAMPIRIGLV